MPKPISVVPVSQVSRAQVVTVAADTIDKATKKLDFENPTKAQMTFKIKTNVVLLPPWVIAFPASPPSPRQKGVVNRGPIQSTWSGLESKLSKKIVEGKENKICSRGRNWTNLCSSNKNWPPDGWAQSTCWWKKIQFFDNWVEIPQLHHLKKFRKNGALDKAIGLDKGALKATETQIVSKAFQRRSYMVDLIKVE